jgi:hypothetical protein
MLSELGEAFEEAVDRLTQVYVLYLTGLRIRIRMDPHLFEMLDPDPHSICGSGSRRAKMTQIKEKSKEISCFELPDVLF